jgi:pimeloyl-ACP methyl ester carboxylesterase
MQHQRFAAHIRACWSLVAAVTVVGCGGGEPASPDGGLASDGAPTAADGGSFSPEAAAPVPLDGDGPVPLARDGAALPSPDAPPGADGAPAGSSDPTATVKVAPLVWGACPDRGQAEQCARVKVPLDYARQDGEEIELLVGRVRATDPARRIGSLLLNPGGPGGPGITDGFLATIAGVVSDEIRARFDLVSWDPRGVSGSTPVDCKAMPSISDIQARYDESAGAPGMVKDIVRAAYRTWISQCQASVGRLLSAVSTDATVSDLEILRVALGDAKLTYMGFSYGTSIGLHYLLRYPERIRAMVLDGVDDIWEQDVQDVDQYRAFDGALAAFLAWCGTAAAADCPFARGMPGPAAAFTALVAAVKARPIPAGAAALNYPLLQFGVVNSLYAQQQWPDLGAALESARRGDGSPLVEAAQGYLGTGAAQDPFYAISCGDDHPVTDEVVESLASKLADSPLALPYANLACVGWPVTDRTAHPGPGPVGPIPPVLVVGTTGDPATPYQWATATAARLPGSVLLTAEAYSHTAYPFDIPCIFQPVDAYLLAGTLPPAGVRCKVAPPKAMASARAKAKAKVMTGSRADGPAPFLRLRRRLR